MAFNQYILGMHAPLPDLAGPDHVPGPSPFVTSICLSYNHCYGDKVHQLQVFHMYHRHTFLSLDIQDTPWLHTHECVLAFLIENYYGKMNGMSQWELQQSLDGIYKTRPMIGVRITLQELIDSHCTLLHFTVFWYFPLNIAIGNRMKSHSGNFNSQWHVQNIPIHVQITQWKVIDSLYTLLHMKVFWYFPFKATVGITGRQSKTH